MSCPITCIVIYEYHIYIILGKNTAHTGPYIDIWGGSFFMLKVTTILIKHYLIRCTWGGTNSSHRSCHVAIPPWSLKFSACRIGKQIVTASSSHHTFGTARRWRGRLAEYSHFVVLLSIFFILVCFFFFSLSRAFLRTKKGGNLRAGVINKLK